MKKKRLHSFLCILVLIHVWFCSSMARTRDADTDREALMAFKSVISDPRDALASWNLSTSHCNWTGVSCTDDGEMRVNSLVLAGLGLSGALPSQLSNLSSIQYLNLSRNSFSGEISSSFGRLTALRRIILARNSISGSIPGNLSRCRSLKEINFEINNITGQLPAELGSLSKLKTLSVSMNNLTGSIPKTYGNLSALTTLSLARNRLSDELPNELRNLLNLTVLQLSENALTGTIPPWIFNISTLEFVSLTQNKLVGRLPSSVSISLANLKRLYLAENMIEGLLPNYLFNSSQIQVLDVSSNRFHGLIPSLGKMKSLYYLHLGHNNLSSSTDLNLQIFHSLVNCTKLEILYLNSNQLAGELPSSIGNLSAHLREFCVDGNHLTKDFPNVLDRYQNLTALSIHNNWFVGKFPGTVGKLRRLQTLQAYENNFYGEIPDIFGNLTQLYLLRMGYNKFSGRLSSSIGSCKQLSVLGLASNSLSGNIPDEIFGLANLRTLLLPENKLNGSLSPLVGRLKQLELLNVSDNQLSGNIPVAIGGCSSLDTLTMARNNLSGQIPGQIGYLSALKSLDLSLNNLSGSIPPKLGDLQILRSLNLSFNHLEGQVPENGLFVNLTWDELQGNNELCDIDAKVALKLRIRTCEAVTNKRSNKHHLLAVLIPVLTSIVLACCILCFTWVIIQKKRRIKKRESSFLSPLINGLPMKVSYDELRRLTNGFAQENFIGKGGFGSVYKAVLMRNNGGSCITLAVKVIDLEQSKASKSFVAEGETLKFIRHRNLVKVLTSCSSIDHMGHEFKALVMEYMPNGNLEKWLYPEDIEHDGSSLSLMQRLNVAIDVASAMDYLHHDCDPPVVHCDLKPGNVLLDDNMVAHVGDFGLARFLHQTQQETSHSTIGLKGSIGYIPPEYGMGSRASTSGDVYSFGILLLEMLVSKKPTDQMFEEGLNLRIFAMALDDGDHKVLDIADPRLFANEEASNSTGSNVSSSSFVVCWDNISLRSSMNPRSSWLMRCEECVAASIRLGLSCAASSAKDRLSMREALAKLHEIKRALLGSIDAS